MLFDTTFLIDCERETMRGQPGPAQRFLEKNPDVLMYISIITAGEFAEGFDPGQYSQFWSCLRFYSILNLSSEIAWRAGQVARKLRAIGQRIGENDCWIAATALQHNLPFVTNNLQHFNRIEKLEVVSY